METDRDDNLNVFEEASGQRVRRPAPAFCVLAIGIGLMVSGMFHVSPVHVARKGGDDSVIRQTESSLVREVTVGGVTRVSPGVLKRTYSDTESGPALCPT